MAFLLSLQPRSQGLSSSLPWKEGKKRDPGNEVVVVVVLRAIMLIIKYLASVKISSQVRQCTSAIASHSSRVFCSH